MAIIIDLGDVSRFKNLDHLSSYVGVMHLMHNSGESERGRTNDLPSKQMGDN